MSGCQVAILAGGKGTRLRARTGDIPKPLVCVAGKPVLVHQIEACRASGLSRVLLLVHHLHEQIRDLLGDGSSLGVELTYQVEASARGTAGALRDALPLLAPRFMVLYGDTYFDVDLNAMWQTHSQRGATVTLFLHPNDHPEDSDLVEIDPQRRVLAIHPYPHPPGLSRRNLVNAALYVFENLGLDGYASASTASDIAKNMFPAMLADGLVLQGYVSPEYIKDMGTPARLDRVEADIERGLGERLSTRGLRQAVFLDRDGTLNREVNHLFDPAQLEMLDGAAGAVRELNVQGMLAVLATNQPVVARGDITPEGLTQVHARMESMLGASGAYLDAIYVCPHHPDGGFDGEVKELKVSCLCRKPGTGLVDAACADLQIDRRQSWFVGDTTTDIECGARSGLRTVLLGTGHAGRDGKHARRPDYVANDLASAVQWILHGHSSIAMQLTDVVSRATGGRLVLIGGLARSGKSSTAQVLRELLAAVGRRAHVVPLDSWLRPAGSRSEGSGVLARYDMAAALTQLLPVIAAKTRQRLRLSTYDRWSRSQKGPTLCHSVGTSDTLIVEGVPALLSGELMQRASLRLHVAAPEAERAVRLRVDYDQRGAPVEDLAQLLTSRNLDEKPWVDRASATADLIVRSGATG